MRVLALVLAGGAGNRLEVLTEARAKPAMPFAGVYRLIDFPLSNCMHSGIPDVWIIQHHEPQSLNDHISNGRPWDLDRTHGGLRLLVPHQEAGDDRGWHSGNADAIHLNRRFISEAGPEVVLVLSSDHVYKLDYSEVVRAHLERGDAATFVTTAVPRDEAGRFGVVEVSEGGRIEGYENKPDDPRSNLVTTEVFVFSTGPLMAALEELAQDGGVEDLGDELLPRLVAEGSAGDYRLEGYWRDLGTVDSYFAAHMDLLEGGRGLDLDDPSWPILTLAPQRPPAQIIRGARTVDSLLSPGCEISGSVENSVLGAGVRVDAGARVARSIILRDAHVGREAVVECSIVDEEVEVEMGATVGSTDAELAVVGRGAVVGNGAHVPAGARVSPGAWV